MAQTQSRKKVAVVGSGAGGMGAMFALANSDHEVHLFEAESSFGGHSCTYMVEKDGLEAGIDFGFIGFNPVTYPNFMNAINYLGVEVNTPPNTLSVSRDNGSFEWGTSAILAQPKNLLKPSFWRMLFDILRFNQMSLDVLIEESKPHKEGEEPHLETMDEYCKRNNYSKQFRDDYLVPMSRLVWSTEIDQVRADFPMGHLIRYLWNHHLLVSVENGWEWMSIKGGTRKYVEAVLRLFPEENLHVNSPIWSVRNNRDGNGGVLLEVGGENGSSRIEKFDHVVLACHAPQSMKIISPDATPEEREILGVFKTTEKDVVLHTDESFMPKTKAAWSCWNHKAAESDGAHEDNFRASTTCWLNLVMNIPEEKFGTLLTSSTPVHDIAPEKLIASWTAAHPWYTPESVKHQELVSRIQNRRGISYCGAWLGFGLHEDGFAAGLKVGMEHLGGQIPFEYKDAKFLEGRTPQLGIKDYLIRMALHCIQGLIVFFVALDL